LAGRSIKQYKPVTLVELVKPDATKEGHAVAIAKEQDVPANIKIFP
jgi:hypothetical protein